MTVKFTVVEDAGGMLARFSQSWPRVIDPAPAVAPAAKMTVHISPAEISVKPESVPLTGVKSLMVKFWTVSENTIVKVAVPLAGRELLDSVSVAVGAVVLLLTTV